MKVFKKAAVEPNGSPGCITSPLLIRTKPSCILLAAVLAAHVCSISAIALSAIPFVLQLACIVFVFFLAVTYCYQWHSTSRFLLQKNQNHQWVFHSDTDKSHMLTLESCYYWSRYLIIFRVIDHQSRRFFYPVVMDSCDAESFRNLRVLAKFLL